MKGGGPVLEEFDNDGLGLFDENAISAGLENLISPCPLEQFYDPEELEAVETDEIREAKARLKKGADRILRERLPGARELALLEQSRDPRGRARAKRARMLWRAQEEAQVRHDLLQAEKGAGLLSSDAGRKEWADGVRAIKERNDRRWTEIVNRWSQLEARLCRRPVVARRAQTRALRAQRRQRRARVRVEVDDGGGGDGPPPPEEPPKPPPKGGAS